MRYTVRDLFNNYFFLSVCSLPFLEPRCLYDMSSMAGIHNLFVLTRYYVALVIICFGVLCVKKISKFCWGMIGFHLIYAITTYLHNTGNASYILKLQITAIGVCILFDLALSFSDKKIINVFAVGLTGLVLSNFLSLFLYPDGMYTSASLNGYWKSNWILGFKNLFIYVILPTQFFLAIREFITQGKLRIAFWAISGVALFSVLRVNAVTSVICVLLEIALIFLFEKKDATFILNARNYLIVSGGISWGLVTASLIPKISSFLSVVNRDLTTMSNRTYIWQNAMQKIEHSLLLGYGREVEASVYANLSAYHSHNQWLDVIYIGGVAGAMFFVSLIIIAVRKSMSIENIRMQNVISSIFLGYFILFITEARRDDLFFYVILITCSHLPQLMKDMKQLKDKKRRKCYVKWLG